MSKISIHQIYFNPEQRIHIKPPAIPLDNGGDQSQEFEYGVFRRSYLAGGLFENIDFAGFLSWRFEEKTMISVDAFQKAIETTPGFDAYAFNPYPWLARYRSLWDSVDMRALMQPIIDAAGHNISLYTETPKQLFLACNFWVANKKFWDRYMAFCEPLRNEMRRVDTGNYFTPYRQGGQFPYLMERIWTTFVFHNPDLKVIVWDQNSWKQRR